jgi:mono/diheme cytochrome c family protein
MIRHYALGLLLIAPVVLAAETPRDVWIKAKCALCHGIDGSSQTAAGRQTNAPDLRLPATQKRSDAELTKSISGGHKRMPSFEKQVRAEKVRLLVIYIRGVAAIP